MQEIQRILLGLVDGCSATDKTSGSGSEHTLLGTPLHEQVLKDTASGPTVQNNSLWNICKQVHFH